MAYLDEVDKVDGHAGGADDDPADGDGDGGVADGPKVFSYNQGVNLILRGKIGRGTTLNKWYPLTERVRISFEYLASCLTSLSNRQNEGNGDGGREGSFDRGGVWACTLRFTFPLAYQCRIYNKLRPTEGERKKEETCS